MATSLRYVVQVQKPTQLNFRAWSIPHRLSLTPSNRQIGFYNWLTWFKTKSLEICRNKCSRIGHGIYGLGSSSQNYVGSMYLAWFNSPCFLKGLTLPPCLTPSTCPLLKIEGKYRQCCHHSQGEAGRQKHLDLNLLRLLQADSAAMTNIDMQNGFKMDALKLCFSQKRTSKRGISNNSSSTTTVQ